MTAVLDHAITVGDVLHWSGVACIVIGIVGGVTCAVMALVVSGGSDR